MIVHAVVAALFALGQPTASDPGEALQRGWLALGEARWQDARAAYLDATTRDPDNEDAWIGLMRAHLGASEPRAAIAAGERALALAPDNAWAHRFIALAYYLAADYPRARRHYEHARSASPADPLVALGLGLTLVRLGEPDPGQALCAEAARALPDDPRVADCFALARAARPRLALGAHVLGLAGTRFGAGDLVATSAAGLALTWPDVLTVTLHPELTWVDAVTLLSAHASFTFTPSPSTWIVIGGFFGERRYTVDDGGLSIWTGDETHRAGARLGGGLRLGDAFALTLEARWLALERLRGDPSLIDHRVGALAGLIITL